MAKGDDDDPFEVEVFQPHQRAWLRRPDLDTPHYDAWEKPDGTLHAAEKGVTPRIAVLKPGRFPGG